MSQPPPPNDRSNSDVEKFRNLTREWFARRANMPFVEMYAELVSVREAILDELGKGLAPHVNRFVRRLSLPEITDKRLLSHWINGLSSAFGIRPVCPRSGLPATMVTGEGTHFPHGRFQFQVKVEGKGFQRPTSSIATPEFSFAPVRLPAAVGPTCLEDLQSRTIKTDERPFGRDR
jgi:hypothetical protein